MTLENRYTKSAPEFLNFLYHPINTTLQISDSIPGVKAPYRDAKTELECFSLFFTDEMLDEIVTHTNVRLQVSHCIQHNFK